MKWLAHEYNSIILCSSVSCGPEALAEGNRYMKRYMHRCRHRVPVRSIETNNWIMGDKVVHLLSNVWANVAHFEIFRGGSFFIWHYPLHCDVSCTDIIIACIFSMDTQKGILFTISIKRCLFVCVCSSVACPEMRLPMQQPPKCSPWARLSSGQPLGGNIVPCFFTL
jgi:hypothetical protein